MPYGDPLDFSMFDPGGGGMVGASPGTPFPAGSYVPPWLTPYDIITDPSLSWEQLAYYGYAPTPGGQPYTEAMWQQWLQDMAAGLPPPGGGGGTSSPVGEQPVGVDDQGNPVYSTTVTSEQQQQPPTPPTVEPPLPQPSTGQQPVGGGGGGAIPAIVGGAGAIGGALGGIFGGGGSGGATGGSTGTASGGGQQAGGSNMGGFAMMPGMMQGAGSLLGGIGALLGSRASDWMRGALTDQQATAMAAYAGAMDPWWQMYQGAVMPGYGWADRADEMRNWAGNYGPYTGANQITPQSITQLYQALGMNTTPAMEGAQQGIGETAGSLTGTRNLAGQGFAGGGWTPMYQQLFDRGSEMLTGAGWQNAAPAGVGGDLLGQRGQNVYTQALQNAALGGLQTQGMNPYLAAGQDIALADLAMGGMTPGLAGLQGMGAGMLQQGGGTPEIAAMSGVGLEGLLRGGGTPTTDLLQGVGGNIFAQEALLPMEQAISAAGDIASNQAISQYEAAQRRAQARGGGPGPVRGGIQNAGMMDYADQAARLISDAQNQAMMQQQQLQLQQRGMGGQVATGAGQLEAGRLGQFGDMMGAGAGLQAQRLGLGAGMITDPARIAAARMGQSYGAIPGMQGAGTDVLSALLGAGQGGMNAEIARMGLGGDLLQNYNQNRLQALGSLGNIQGLQNQYALGLGGLQNQMAGTQGNLLSNQFQNWLGGGQQGINRASAISGNWLGAQSGTQGWNQLANQMWSTGMGMPMNAMGQLADIARGWQGPFNTFGASGSARV